jgi:hypothetical protein
MAEYMAPSSGPIEFAAGTVDSGDRRRGVCRLRCAEDGAGLLSGEGGGVQPPLCGASAHGAQPVGLFGGLHALCDHLEAEGVARRDEEPHEFRDLPVALSCWMNDRSIFSASTGSARRACTENRSVPKSSACT